MELNKVIEFIRNGKSNLSEKAKDGLCSPSRKWKQFDEKSIRTNFNGLTWTVELVTRKYLRISCVSYDGAGAFFHVEME